MGNQYRLQKDHKNNSHKPVYGCAPRIGLKEVLGNNQTEEDLDEALAQLGVETDDTSEIVEEELISALKTPKTMLPR